MILTLDVGNSQIFGGVFDGDQLQLSFRKASRQAGSSDEFGLFLRGVLRENGLDPAAIRQIAICSVVPDLVHSLTNCCKKYFDVNPFVLQAGAKTGLKIKYRNPLEVGADRIANAIAATHLYPGQPLIVIDFGTATTYCAINAQREYLGGIILPGLRTSMQALESNTARLPAVEILTPSHVVGRTTIESIQSGLVFGNLAIMQGLIPRIEQECFDGEEAIVMGTGGFARMYENDGVFDALIPDLVLTGLRLALAMNE